MIQQAPLALRNGHLFVQFGGEELLLDTGAPCSFNSSQALEVAGRHFTLQDSYLGLTRSELSDLVCTDTSGLIGVDVLSSFDVVMDLPNGTITFSTGPLEFGGCPVALEEFMGIPICCAHVGGRDFRMFIDTGAQISYIHPEVLRTFPHAGTVSDFYLGIGQFQVETHMVDVMVGETTFALRCGNLPELLDVTIRLAGAQGIIGNEMVLGRTVGYSSRRKLLTL